MREDPLGGARLPSTGPRKTVKLLYFAWVRQKIGLPEEELTPPSSVTNVAGLVDFLRQRGPGYEAAFRELKGLRVAINQHHSGFDAAVGPHDEVAFFPPVTGG
jgi:molybdopterin synthase sulfur carrier subunit